MLGWRFAVVERPSASYDRGYKREHYNKVMRSFAHIMVITMGIAVLSAPSAAGEFSLDEAKGLAIKAAAFLEREGIYKALKLFRDPDTGFVRGAKGKLYVFVLTFEGDLLFHPRPDLEGRNGLDWRDDNGIYYIREMISIAKDDGQGWVEYLSWDPGSEEVRPKVSFVTRVGRERILVGAGITLDKGMKFI